MRECIPYTKNIDENYKKTRIGKEDLEHSQNM